MKRSITELNPKEKEMISGGGGAILAVGTILTWAAVYLYETFKYRKPKSN